MRETGAPPGANCYGKFAGVDVFLQDFGRQNFNGLGACFMEVAVDLREAGGFGGGQSIQIGQYRRCKSLTDGSDDGAQIIFQRAISRSHPDANFSSQQSQLIQGFA